VIRIFSRNQALALAAALLVLILLGWGFGVYGSAGPRAVPAPGEAAVHIEAVGPGLRPVVLVFPERPTLAQVLAELRAESPCPDGGARLADGSRVRLGPGPDGRTAVYVGPMSAPALLALGRKMNVNQAGYGDLILLPGIGPKTAGWILADRSVWGMVGRFEGLDRVRGIGPKGLERLRPYLTAGAPEEEKRLPCPGRTKKGGEL
jgi:DNA uptake protein ComE-like DNA-binding protein